jgi:catechol 2,3-dioxygenase-like lactoylglutathione lyase family enzyme
MTLPAESQVGRRAARPARSDPGRWMAVLDRIRLTGRLREGPAQAGPFYFVPARAASRPSRSASFTAPDRAAVDAFHEAALAAGGTDNGEPGLREIYHPSYYGAFVLDPDGNNVEAVCHRPPG